MSEQETNLDDTNPREPVTPPRGMRRVSAPNGLPEDTPAPQSTPRKPTARDRQPQAAPRKPAAEPPKGRGYTSYYPTDPEAKPAKKNTARTRRDSGLYLPWWSLVVMLVAVGCAAVGSLLVVNSLGGAASPGGATPMVVVITATFTVGPPASQTTIPQRASQTPTKALPTIASTATLPAGNIAIGSTIQIVGVGGSGLNVRSGPGKQYTAKFLAFDGQSYLIKDGPQTASDEEWWYIQDPTNPNTVGWASRRFLQVTK